MTRKELNQFYYVQKEIEMWEAELKSIGLHAIEQGVGRSSMPGDPTAMEAAKLEKIRNTIERLRSEAVNIRAMVVEHIATLDDSQMRQIVMHRCIYLETWDSVALALGGGNTADNVRMRFNRQYPV